MQIAVKLPGRTWLWWGSMVAIAFLNLLLFRHVNRSKRARDVEHKRYQRVLKMLCLPFLFDACGPSVQLCVADCLVPQNGASERPSILLNIIFGP